MTPTKARSAYKRRMFLIERHKKGSPQKGLPYHIEKYYFALQVTVYIPPNWSLTNDAKVAHEAAPSRS